MLDFTRANLEKLAIHHAGNAGLGQAGTLSTQLIPFENLDTVTQETIFTYLIGSFRSDGKLYQFRERDNFSLIGSVANVVETYLKNVEDNSVDFAANFLRSSQVLCNRLTQQTMHPRLRDGYFYAVEFKDVVLDGFLYTHAIGLYKAETENSFLQLHEDDAGVFIDHKTGFSIDKIDYGALILGTNVLIFEKGKRIAETASYWTFDFLNIEPQPVSYFLTQRLISNMERISEEMFADLQDEVKKKQMNRSTLNYLEEHERYDEVDFVETVAKELEFDEVNAIQLHDKIKELKKEALEHVNVMLNDFEISAPAIKENKSIAKSKIKLDKNFEIIVKGDSSKIEYGHDEDKNTKFIKLYYHNIKVK